MIRKFRMWLTRHMSIPMLSYATLRFFSIVAMITQEDPEDLTLYDAMETMASTLGSNK